MTNKVPRLQVLPLQMPEDPMTPEMEAAAWEGLATNPAAQMAAEGNDTVARWLHQHDQVAISRERLGELEGELRHLRQLRLDLEDRAAATDQQHAAETDHYTAEMQRLTDRLTAEIRRLTATAVDLQRKLTDRDEQLKHLNAEQLNAANRASRHDGEARP